MPNVTADDFKGALGSWAAGVTVVEEPAQGAADESLAELDLAMTVRDALAAVGEPCSDLLDRFFTRDESYKTISERLEIPPGTIASRISRCLVKLRGQIEGRNDGAGPSGVR